MQPICVHLRSSAVRDFDTHSLHRIKYLTLSSYEFVLSSLFIFHLAVSSLLSSAINELDSEINPPLRNCPHPRPPHHTGAAGISESAELSKQIYDKYDEIKIWRI